jgi:two-component system catabolic regulation response regulator CreB/two-component system response regulator ChvI
MNDLSTKTSVGYYNKFKRILGSFNTKYYDEIITKLHLQAIQQYKYSKPQKQNEKLQQEKKLHSQKRKNKILLVDDEPDICMSYQIVLQDAGHQCISYTDSVKALQEFRPNYYDLILLDIKMPRLNGFELCKKIIDVDKNIKVIFLTAGEEYHEEFRNQSYPEINGNTNYIQKPIGNQELVRLVNIMIDTNDAK